MIIHVNQVPKSIGDVVGKSDVFISKMIRDTPEDARKRDAQDRNDAYMLDLRKKRFLALCPPLYQGTDDKLLPPEQYEDIMAWTYGPHGLLLIGPTATGKTRCAWMLMRRLILDGRSVKAFDGLGWGIAVSKAFGEPATAEQWLDSVCRADVLFIDDLFKAKMTEAQEQAALGVFERRTANLKPIIVTMNSTPDMILGRMSEHGREDRGDPMIRRMKEFCQVIVFSNKEKLP